MLAIISESNTIWLFLTKKERMTINFHININQYNDKKQKYFSLPKMSFKSFIDQDFCRSSTKKVMFKPTGIESALGKRAGETNIGST